MNEAPILINVDDVETERSRRHAVLSNAGYQVYDAVTWQQTLDLLEQHHPNLVVIHVTNGKSKEICGRLKQHSSKVPVLQIAADGAASDSADTCLTEPVDSGVLIPTLNSMLRQREAESALRESNARLEGVQQELQRANEDFQQFAYVAGHGLQESLRTVSTFLELLDREAHDRLTETEKGYITHVTSGAKRMRNLIDDLVAYSRVGREKQTSGAVAMSAVVAWAVADLGKQVPDSGASVLVEGRLPKVWGDFAQLGEVVRNLLSNAIKFRRPDLPPVVQIRGQEDPSEQCVISIRDNGIGIAREYHERIFIPFKRLHGQDIPGSGMGLAVCRRIMNLHGGAIWVESEPERGSTFFLRLPAAAGRSESRERG